MTPGLKNLASNLIDDTVDFFDHDDIHRVAIPNVDSRRCPECGARGYLDFIDSDWSDGQSNDKVFFFRCSNYCGGIKCEGRVKVEVKE